MNPRKLHFRYRPDKAADAAAWLIRRAGGEVRYIRIIKLLYLADRESLQQRHRPITGDTYVSMDLGPVLSLTYDSIQGLQDPSGKSDVMAKRLKSTSRYMISVRDNSSLDSLSEDDEAILERIHRRFETMTWKQICNWTHKLPEWEDPNGSSIPIDPAILLRAIGLTDPQIQEIADAERRMRDLDKLLPETW